MSAGGQRGIDISGVGGMRIRDAGDFVTQRQLQLTYQTYASVTGANAFMGDQVNSSFNYLRFLEGLRESVGTANGCTTCSNAVGQGLPYQYSATWTFRNKY